MNSGPTSSSEDSSANPYNPETNDPHIIVPQTASGSVARQREGAADSLRVPETKDETEYSAPDEEAPLAPLPDHGLPVADNTPPLITARLDEPNPNAPPNEKEIDIFEHLGELRQRLLYCVAATALALCGTWNYGAQLTDWFSRPIRAELARHNLPGVNNTLITIDPTEAFLLYFQVTLVAALLLVMPFILFQAWRFIEPALTPHERRYGLVVVPFSVLLFFTGAALGYWMSPVFFRFFLAFQPMGVAANLSYGKSAALLAKMLLVFGVCFQVPVVTILLHKVGLVSRNILIEYWRHVVLAIFVAVAILTPTWDPFTLVVCALPPCVLYAGSIWLVKWL